MSRMANEAPTIPRRRCFNPFLVIFCGLFKLMIWVFKTRPSALQLENNALHEQLQSLKERITAQVRKADELENLNSTLDATVMKLQLEGGKLLDVLKLQEQEIDVGNKQLTDYKELAERLGRELHNRKDKNGVLEVLVKEQGVLMENKKAEWMSMDDKQKQKTRSLEEKLEKQFEKEEKNTWYIMVWDNAVEQRQRYTNGLRSEKEELKKSCNKLVENNRRLKGELTNLKVDK